MHQINPFITTTEFENIVLLGDFNMTPENTKMEQLLNTLSLESQITSLTSST